MLKHERDYAAVAGSVAEQVPSGADTKSRMQIVVDALWTAFSEQGISWCGFYLPDEEELRLLLGPRRDKPACSPIGLHGACGRAYRQRKPLLVDDVRDLGPDYIACDPRDLSEVVVPLLADDGKCMAVLDLDSHDAKSFAAEDVRGLQAVLAAAGLSSPQK